MKYNYEEMKKRTLEEPIWMHFGVGNIFRCYIAVLQERLLDAGLCDRGIIGVAPHDYEVVEKAFRPFHNRIISVTLGSDGKIVPEEIYSVAETYCANPERPEDVKKIREYFAKPSLQLVSLTITEKGYAKNSPTMKLMADLLLDRFRAGAAPIALVSMDNCAHNGEKLRNAVLEEAEKKLAAGEAGPEYLAWISDESKVAFPWTMIDKIVPRPDEIVYEALKKAGYEHMEPIETSKHTFIAPFANAEEHDGLVIEDSFPNGRPPLEKVGVYMVDRDTVNKVERMKVMTCLNPLHTALAVYGCLLGFKKISAEMKDPQLHALVEKIGYVEGLPVVVHPGIIAPKDFIDEVVNKRFPNPFVPDTPQRIAVDTSQKVGIRFGETIRAYEASSDKDVKKLTFIPLAIAGWLRYLHGTYDDGTPMDCSPDPRLEELQQKAAAGKYEEILSDKTIFGSDLMKLGLGEKIIGMVKEELAGPGAVRATLIKYLG